MPQVLQTLWKNLASSDIWFFTATQRFTDDQNIRNLRRMVLHDDKNAEARVDISAQQFAEVLRMIVGLFNPMTEYAKFLVTTFSAKKQL